MKKMRIRVLSIFAALAGLLMLANVASAINLPLYMEFDLDNWTRLYIDDETLYPLQVDPPIPEGLMSRAFITFSDISPTVSGFPSVPDPGGSDAPPTWIGGTTDGTWLHGWEDNVVIDRVITQNDGSNTLYFTHAPGGGWEFEVYQTQISFAEFTAGPGYLADGPTMFNSIQANLAGHATSVPFVRGMFSESLYVDPFLIDPAGDGSLPPIDIGFGPGLVLAVAAINQPGINQLGGEWTNQINTPYLLGINAFVDVDPDWGIGDQFQQNFYGWPEFLSPFMNTDPYDLAIQNVRLNSELSFVGTDGEFWIISDDGVRAASGIPEPATMLLLGTGLVGLAGGARRRKKKQA